MTSLKDILKTVAPALGTAVGKFLGGFAVKAGLDALGIEDTTDGSEEARLQLFEREVQNWVRQTW